MIENFFADYKNFVVVPKDEKQVLNEVYDPKNYVAYYILTLTIYDSRLSTWKDASKFEIDVEKSIKTELENFNQSQHDRYHLQLLELDRFKNYFILALSAKSKINQGEEKEQIAYIVDKLLTNPFYVRQGWFNLIGDKGRVARKLFTYSYKEYKAGDQDQNQLKREEKYEKFSERIPKNGEIKLIKGSLIRDIL